MGAYYSSSGEKPWNHQITCTFERTSHSGTVMHAHTNEGFLGAEVGSLVQASANYIKFFFFCFFFPFGANRVLKVGLGMQGGYIFLIYSNCFHILALTDF